jgi:hypothetical protein
MDILANGMQTKSKEEVSHRLRGLSEENLKFQRKVDYAACSQKLIF